VSSERRSSPERDEFRRLGRRRATGVVREYYDYLRHHKKWWLAPVIALLLLVGMILVLGSSAVAPLIYTLF
jgi:hypothetical protein